MTFRATKKSCIIAIIPTKENSKLLCGTHKTTNTIKYYIEGRVEMWSFGTKLKTVCQFFWREYRKRKNRILTGLRSTILLFMIFKWFAITSYCWPNSLTRWSTLAASISIINESGNSSCCADMTRSSDYEMSISIM